MTHFVLSGVMGRAEISTVTAPRALVSLRSKVDHDLTARVPGP